MNRLEYTAKRFCHCYYLTNRNSVRSSMIKKSLFIVILCFGFTAFGQENKNDSVQPILTNHLFGSEKQISIRVGFGLQKSFYTELGIALHKCNYGDVGFFSNDLYSALEWTPTPEQDIYGLKIGYEANISLLNLGIEVKYQTDFTNRDVVITPKIGLGIFGDVNVFYGYNISTNHNPFIERIKHHQFSIVFNFNKHFLRYR